MSIYSLETHGDISGSYVGDWFPEKHDQPDDDSAGEAIDYDDRSVDLDTKGAGVVEALKDFEIEPRGMHECTNGDKCVGACDGHYPYEQEQDESDARTPNAVKVLAQLALF